MLAECRRGEQCPGRQQCQRQGDPDRLCPEERADGGDAAVCGDRDTTTPMTRSVHATAAYESIPPNHEVANTWRGVRCVMPEIHARLLGLLRDLEHERRREERGSCGGDDPADEDDTAHERVTGVRPRVHVRDRRSASHVQARAAACATTASARYTLKQTARSASSP